MIHVDFQATTYLLSFHCPSQVAAKEAVQGVGEIDLPGLCIKQNGVGRTETFHKLEEFFQKFQFKDQQ